MCPTRTVPLFGSPSNVSFDSLYDFLRPFAAFFGAFGLRAGLVLSVELAVKSAMSDGAICASSSPYAPRHAMLPSDRTAYKRLPAKTVPPRPSRRTPEASAACSRSLSCHQPRSQVLWRIEQSSFLR